MRCPNSMAPPAVKVSLYEAEPSQPPEDDSAATSGGHRHAETAVLSAGHAPRRREGLVRSLDGMDRASASGASPLQPGLLLLGTNLSSRSALRPLH